MKINHTWTYETEHQNIWTSFEKNEGNPMSKRKKHENRCLAKKTRKIVFVEKAE